MTVIEDFRLDIVIPAGKNSEGETINIDIPKFCFVGATTEMGDLVQPFLDRFKLKHFVRQYSVDELSLLLSMNAAKMNLAISDDALATVARVSRGTPRIANNFLEWLREYSIAYDIQGLQKYQATQALEMQGIDENGLNPIDRRYIEVLKNLPKGSAIGVNTLCSALSVDKQTIEQKIEPYLIQQGYIGRTPKGRVLLDYEEIN